MMILRISECFYSLEAVINTNKNGMLHLFHGFKKCVIERRIFEICWNISYQMVWSGIRYYTIVLIEKISHYATYSCFKLTYYGKMEF